MSWRILARTGSLIAAAGSAAVLAVFGAVPAAASGDYMGGANGTDVSWPQCGTDVPLDSTNFAIIGVNNGAPFTMNPCFAQQFAWSHTGHAAPASVYINLQYGETSSGYNHCDAADRACAAYDFGYLAAQYAYTVANYTTHGDSLKAATWWLDVETENVWDDSTALNSRVIQGAIDYLKTTRHRVGVYSTQLQWGEITGGYNPGSGVGNWIAGAEGLDDYTQCYNSLWPGAPVWAYQYLNLDLDLDQDHSC